MTGGLIQIASYGIHDIYLIGNPQITFFKIVYKRHCNFSMEYIEEQLENDCNFGTESNCIVSKAGDLLHKLYLKIVIPQVIINKNNNTISNINNNTFIGFYNNYKTSYNLIINFINAINFKLIQPLYKYIQIGSFKYSELNLKYKAFYNKMNYPNELSKLNNIIITFYKSFRIPLKIQTSINHIINFSTNITIKHILDFNTYFLDSDYINTSISNTLIFNNINNLLFNYNIQLKIIKEQLNNQLKFYTTIYNKIIRENVNFAWVEFLGHQIINRIEIEIGGKVIDFTDAVRMNLHYQLTNKIFHDETYNKLIGNVSELTTFNTEIKPSYIMYIPLDFWFSKYSGLSIPLIFLRYHDVKINIKLNSLVNCCYYEELKSDIFIENLIKLDSVSLIINYIYLDTDERKKFAQLSHEYLIDQSQVINYKNVNISKINLEIPFYNPIKQLFWITRDYNNINRLKYFDYSMSYYVDIFQFKSVNLLPGGLIKHRENVVCIETVEYNLSKYLQIGDEIEIINSIYYSGKYKILLIENQYMYINYSYYVNESYLNNYTQIFNNTYIYDKTTNYSGNSQAFIYKIINKNPIDTSTLELNSISLFDNRNSIYNNFVQPYQHNSRAPNYGLNTYSFALLPEEHQPNGFCNFNKLDLANLTIQFNPDYLVNNGNKTVDVLIYAHGYNILQYAYGKAKIVFNL
jgi:hypothetical protein